MERRGSEGGAPFAAASCTTLCYIPSTVKKDNSRWIQVGLLVWAGLGILISSEAPTLARGTQRTVARSTWADRALDRRLRALGRLGATPRGVVPLLGVGALRGWVTPTRYARFLRSAARRRLHPLVRDRLAWLELGQALIQGKPRRAARLRRRLGLAERIWYVGPFDNESNQGRTHRYGPEVRPGRVRLPERTWVGKGHLVRWAPLPDLFPSGVLAPGELMEGGRNSVVYLRVDVQARRTHAVALRLGTSCGYRVWHNGRLVADRQVTRPVHLDQDAIGLTLTRGRNVLLLKLVATPNPPRLILRITGVKGGAAAGVRYLRIPAGRGAKPAGVTVFGVEAAPRPERGVTVVTAQALLEGAAARKTATTEALAAWTRYLLYVVPKDPREGAARAIARRLMAKAPGGTSARLLAAACRDRDEARRALERALGFDPKDAMSLVRLAEHASAAERYRDAERLLRRAIAADPTLLRARLSLAELARVRQIPSLARRLLEAVIRTFGAGRPRVERAMAGVELDLGLDRRAERRLEGLVKADSTDLSGLARLIRIARRRGDLGRLERWLRAELRTRPTWLRPRIALGEALVEGGHPREALRVLRAALAWAPGLYRLHRGLARLALRAGLRSQARLSLRKAISIRPQAAADKRLLAHLERRGRDPLVQRWARDGLALARGAARRPPGGTAGAVVLSSTTAYELLPSGLARRFVQQVVYIRNQQGVNAFRQVTVDYQPDRQELQIPVARVLRAGGEEVEARRLEVGMTDPSVRAYYDRRLAVMRFPDLRPGDVLEVQTVRADVPAQNAFRGAFGVIVPLQLGFPIREVRVAVSLPLHQPLFANRPRLRQLRRQERTEGDRRLLVWTAKEVSAVEPEPSSPGWAETHAYLHLSGFRTWTAVARWYWGLIREQLRPDDAIRAAARAAVRSKRSSRDKVLALYHLVIRKTRYVALSFGLHTYKPYPVAQVFARRFGDCKDKAALLKVLLAVVGIPSRIALLRTRPQGRLAPSPPSLAAFDHAILYVPSLHLWLDGTAERTGSGELPWADQGVDALLVGPSGGRLARTPVLPSRANRVTRKLQIRLHPDGSGDVTEERTITGQRARLWRSTLTDAQSRARSVQQDLAPAFPGVRVTSVSSSGPEALERSVTLHMRYRVPHLARRLASGRLVASLSLRSGSWTRALAPRSSRKLPVALAYPFEKVLDVSLRFPAALRLEQAPTGGTVRLRLPAGRPPVASRGGGATGLGAAFDAVQTVRASATGLTIHRRVAVRRRRWSPADYPALRRVLTRADRLFEAPATWVVTAGTPRASPRRAPARRPAARPRRRTPRRTRGGGR